MMGYYVGLCCFFTGIIFSIWIVVHCRTTEWQVDAIKELAQEVGFLRECIQENLIRQRRLNILKGNLVEAKLD